MTRETRLIVTLVAVSVAGITLLAIVADQYRKRLPQPAAGAPASAPAQEPAAGLRPDLAAPPDGSETPSARAARLVDGFLAARVAAQGVAERYPTKMKQVVAAVTKDFTGVEGKRMGYGLDVISAYKIDRYNAFTAHGMTFDDYAAVRTAWRAWSAGQPVADDALARAFEAKRGDAEKAGEGLNEAFDDAVR